MKNLKALSNTDLIAQLKSLVTVERDTLVKILWHLREIEARRIHLDAGFPSLFDYCTRELHYSAGAAARRISAMRLLRDVPSVEPKIRSGELQLSQLAQVQNHFRQETKEGKEVKPEEKEQLLTRLEGKSSRETEQILVGLNPRNVPTERERAITAELTEIRFIASSTLLKKIETLKNRLSHAVPDAGYAELFERLVDQELQKRSVPANDSVLRPAPEPETAQERKPEAQISEPRRLKNDRVPSALRKQVFDRAGGHCEYQAPDSGQRCHSRFQLELDHIRPLGKGGASTLDNLRVYCRQHNLRAAEKTYGGNFMAKFRRAG